MAMVFERITVRAVDELRSLPPAEWLTRIRAGVRGTTPLKDYRESASTFTCRLDLEDCGPVFLKEYRLTGKSKVLSLFRESRARRVWWMADQLRSCGCEVPRPVLLIEVRCAGILRESYLATEWLMGRISLADWYRSQGQSGGSEVEEKILGCVRTAADFHRHGAIHGDLKWSNFLLPAEGGGEVVLVDLDAARFDSGAAARGKDLARFAISALEVGMPREMVAKIHEEYCQVFQQAQADRHRKAYEGYVRKRVPQFFR
jgi:tRNA A-37 threonylcarbamoyl transferase component Bud32